MHTGQKASGIFHCTVIVENLWTDIYLIKKTRSYLQKPGLTVCSDFQMKHGKIYFEQEKQISAIPIL
ncbi:MAG: hypothetical protein B6245_05945 [Desulfobacteraceae bacterium 4572_88]|nr:MAG: hypothetical protein B6245_05945 [Desulfobacteraceae bacterium 4572_88]